MTHGPEYEVGLVPQPMPPGNWWIAHPGGGDPLVGHPCDRGHCRHCRHMTASRPCAIRFRATHPVCNDETLELFSLVESPRLDDRPPADLTSPRRCPQRGVAVQLVAVLCGGALFDRHGDHASDEEVSPPADLAEERRGHPAEWKSLPPHPTLGVDRNHP